MSRIGVPVPEDIAPFVREAHVEGLCVLEVTACSAAPLRLDWTAFALPSPGADMSFLIDGLPFEITPVMSSSLIPAVRGQTVRAERTGPCRPILCFLFDPDRLMAVAAELFAVTDLELQNRPYPAAGGLRGDAARLIEEAFRDTPESRAVAECLGTVVAIDCLRSVLPGASVAASFRHGHVGIRDALRSIAEGYGAPLTLDTLAETAHLSKSWFIARFRQETGQTPHEYLRRLRVEKAMQFLREGSDVTRTCFDVGFTSMSGFEEAFFHVAGMKPVDYKGLSGA